MCKLTQTYVNEHNHSQKNTAACKQTQPCASHRRFLNNTTASGVTRPCPTLRAVSLRKESIGVQMTTLYGSSDTALRNGSVPTRKPSTGIQNIPARRRFRATSRARHASVRPPQSAPLLCTGCTGEKRNWAVTVPEPPQGSRIRQPSSEA